MFCFFSANVNVGHANVNVGKLQQMLRHSFRTLVQRFNVKLGGAAHYGATKQPMGLHIT